MVNSI